MAAPSLELRSALLRASEVGYDRSVVVSNGPRRIPGVVRSAHAEPFDVAPTTTSLAGAPRALPPQDRADARDLPGSGAEWTDIQSAREPDVRVPVLALIPSLHLDCQRSRAHGRRTSGDTSGRRTHRSRSRTRSTIARSRAERVVKSGCPGCRCVPAMARAPKRRRAAGYSLAALSHEVIVGHWMRTGPPQVSLTPGSLPRRQAANGHDNMADSSDCAAGTRCLFPGRCCMGLIGRGCLVAWLRNESREERR